ncbi:glycoside hydrolase family 16 protein [Marinoscillum sp. MHG1-6]|uniref:glycoside hydrolase family 16 protein n=1 Tax=Marinoscillum sp. MHG1-6 TaxID=2959627 RepID=UPI002157D6AE|nr:glycoside hydrolase family 16 protein [Marinoscillum sp. MHG1-6]
MIKFKWKGLSVSLFFGGFTLLLAECKVGINQQYEVSLPLEVEEAGYLLKWKDDFNTLNPEYWTVGLKDSISGDMVPGASGRYLLNDYYDAYYTEEDVFIENGELVLQNRKRKIEGVSPEGTFHYTSGWVMSMHKVYFNEGYVEVRAQFPRGDKVWPAIWLIPEDLTWCPEWDLFEYFGYRSDLGFDQMGMHQCYSRWPDEEWKDYFIPDFDEKHQNEQWHVYGFLWTSEYAVWYLDGKEVRRLSSQGISDWPSKDMYIVLNNGTRTESPDSDTEWPNYFRIDYIKLFEK